MKDDGEIYTKDWIDKLKYSIADDYLETDFVINYFLYGDEYLEKLKAEYVEYSDG